MRRCIPFVALLVLFTFVFCSCPKPRDPAIGALPDALGFGTTLTTLAFEVWNRGDAGSVLDFQVSTDTPWVASLEPKSGTSTGSGDKVVVTVTVSRAGLAKADYSGTITVSAANVNPATVYLSMSTVPAAEGEAEGEGEGEPTDKATIIGWVSDTEGDPVAFAKVTVDGGVTTYTDDHGLYTVPGVEPSDEVTVSFSKPGYTTNATNVGAAAEEVSTANVALAQRAEAQVLPNAAAGGTVEDTEGNAITLPVGALVDSARKAVTGDVEVQITALDLSDPSEKAAFPGDFRGVTAKSGAEVQLESFAVADFVITQNGEELDLAPGVSADIALQLPGDTSLELGETVPLWYFDEEQGVWIESGMGTVESDGSGGLVYAASVPHLSWWNCDKPLEETHCVRGRVLNTEGQPVAGARIEARGLSYNGSSFATTDANGRYCVDVKRDSQVQVLATLPGGREVVAAQDVTVPDAAASCDTGGCTDVSDMTASFDACVSGFVKREDGTPFAGVTVFNSWGGRAVTDSTGYYCMDAPGGVTVSVFALGRPLVDVRTMVDTYCGTGDCVQANIEIEYPESGDLVGYVTALCSSNSDAKAGSAGVTSYAYFFAHIGDAPGVEELTDVDDTCTVHLDPPAEGEGEGEEDEERLGALDPGVPGSVTNGVATAEMVRLYDYYVALFMELYGSTESLIFDPAMMGIFMQEPGLEPRFQLGDTLTYSWPGGVDIGPFSASLQVVGPPDLASPEITDGPYGTHYVNIDLGTSLPLVWDAASPGTLLNVMVVSTATPLSGVKDVAGTRRGYVNCVLRDDGSHTIPAALLGQLPVAGPGEKQQILFSVTRFKYGVANVPLVAGGNGVVILMSYGGVAATNPPAGVP
ncbi:MAG TPA: carboxypeptidase regulatory-like domain-containing protein [Candidatus Hydrogenedentes bacterium]|nr:carboxypeptidase regulatory-like domain-containing protein [Candidatus Hydrogenedentota bacterium]HPG69395.1 carboxypeptidase regulatory-like domain-containing protein [Candidatus Hydrogenedentota bacterium]